MSKKTNKTAKKAVNNVVKGYCPKCGISLNYDHGEIQDDFYRYDVNCSKCGWYGSEDYRLEFVGFWDLKTDKEIPKNVCDHAKTNPLTGKGYSKCDKCGALMFSGKIL